MKRDTNKSRLSLFSYFKPGDRVKRKYNKQHEKSKHYEGIILSMDHDQLEIYWDTLDGIYCPEFIRADFTLCDAQEVLKGNQLFTPVKHKKIPR